MLSLVTCADGECEYGVKKPTKWMTNCKQLAELLSLRCEGNHSHVRLEGGNLTKQAASYPHCGLEDIALILEKQGSSVRIPSMDQHEVESRQTSTLGVRIGILIIAGTLRNLERLVGKEIEDCNRNSLAI